MTDNHGLIATQAKDKGLSIDDMVKHLLSSPQASKAELERLEKMRVEENLISCYSPYSPGDWIDERPRIYNDPFAPKIEIIDGKDLFNFVSTNIIHRFRDLAASCGQSIGEFLEGLLIERLDAYEPVIFDLTMTTESRFDLNSFNARLSESTYNQLERKARLLGLGKNQLLTYFLTDVIVELSKE